MPRMPFLPCLLAMIGLPLCAAAQDPVYFSSAGDRFAMTCNRFGYVVHLIPGGQKIYLGASCDVSSSTFGGGSWCQANGGFGLTAGPFEAFFPRQEPWCPGAGYSPYSCLCQ